MPHAQLVTLILLAAGCLALLLPARLHAEAPRPDGLQQIKAFCLDFNWAGRRGFAPYGTWRNADPAATVAWHKQLGSNVIQTFCVSSNGYAWYKGGPVPEQPGLKHDFLREVVKLGHAEGMLVMGYFTIGANTRWGEANPELSYGTPSTYHLPYTDEYLAYLDAAISDAVKTTGIDGFMIDWVWQPRRKSTDGKWIEAEKNLYEQLMGEPFPGEDELTDQQDLAYSRKAIDRCWKTIQKAAKSANPGVIIWLTSNRLTHPHVVDSDMYRQVDWLMAEAGNMRHIEQVKGMIGEDTRLITCLAEWNGQDPTQAVPEAMRAGVGLYGFAKPRNNSGVIPLDRIFPRQVTELSGDAQNIAVLARAYHGKSIHAVWDGEKFVEPESPPPFDISFRRRGRGWQDTGRVDHEKGGAVVTIRTPYRAGRAKLTREADAWPAAVKVRLLKHKQRNAPNVIRIANGTLGLVATLNDQSVIAFGQLDDGLNLGRPWGKDFAVSKSPVTATVLEIEAQDTEEYIEATVPPQLTADNPEALVIEWAENTESNIR